LPKNADIDDIVKAIFEVKKKGYFMNATTPLAIFKGRKKATNPFDNRLSGRETEVIKLICKQKSLVEIAKKLGLSPRTIETHKRNILKKTKTKNTAGIVLYALNSNLLGGLF
jgi:DNA-binding NarL/FixJ family response regulator